MEPVSETDVVIYHVEIKAAGPASWYAEKIGASYDCILEICDRPFNRGQMIKYKVLGAFCPIKYILQVHCEVKTQRLATEKEITGYYNR
jgi:hypothetical protein